MEMTLENGKKRDENRLLAGFIANLDKQIETVQSQLRVEALGQCRRL
jgi:hypothetical protein